MHLSLLICSFVEMVPALLLESPDRQLYLLSEKLTQGWLGTLSSLCPDRYDHFTIRASNNF